jgi:bifunctional non-homologous end joining protein LigD
MSLRERAAPRLGIIEPCLPSPAKAPPSGSGWLHEIKLDGIRLLARRDKVGVWLITRHGNDFTHRFPFIEMAVKSLSVRSCLIDGEAIVCDESGLPIFDLIRGHRAHASAELCAFDLLELDGRDLRREPIEERKRLLANQRPLEAGAAFLISGIVSGRSLRANTRARSHSIIKCSW